MNEKRDILNPFFRRETKMAKLKPIGMKDTYFYKLGDHEGSSSTL